MARPRPLAKTVHEETLADSPGVLARINEECLELDCVTPDELTVLRRWAGRVNGPTDPQPYLVESRPGRFRLYVGDAAIRMRTERGIQ